MCGRYVLKNTLEDLKEYYGANPEDKIEFKPVYNVAPTFNMPVIIQTDDENRSIAKYRWGLVPFWAKEVNTGYSMINARAETLSSKKTFKSPFRKQRCLIPANGFFEWKKSPDGKKVPHYITPIGQELMSFAGLYEHWRGQDGQIVNSYTIITTEANETMKSLHDRMPAILLPEEFDMWLDPQNQDTQSLTDLLRPYPDDGITYHQVSREVNNPQNQDASLVEPTKNNSF